MSLQPNEAATASDGALDMALEPSAVYGRIMPQIDEADLAELIVNGKIGAISLDTSIFDRFQCNFGSPALSALEQLREKHIKVLVSEIVPMKLDPTLSVMPLNLKEI